MCQYLAEYGGDSKCSYDKTEALAHVAVEETRRNAEVEFGPNGSPCDKGFKDAFGNHPVGEAYSYVISIFTLYNPRYDFANSG